MGCICMTAMDLVLTLKLSGFLLLGLALVSVLKQARDRVASYPSSSSSPRCIFKTTCISVLRMEMGCECDLDSKKKILPIYHVFCTNTCAALLSSYVI